MAPNPPAFLAHLHQKGYHPRSDKHSNVLAECLVSDLVRACQAIRDKASSGQLVYGLNFNILTGTAEWKCDLVLGEPQLGPLQVTQPGAIRRERPSTVQIAIEIKAVMTEHRKAVKNRKRDFEAHHDHVHRYNNRAVAGGLLVVNISPTFHSPLRRAPTAHRNPASLVEHCTSEMRAVSVRSDPSGTGLEAKGVIVVDFDNLNFSAGRYETRRPAPQVGDPLHYDAFIQAICSSFTARFR